MTQGSFPGKEAENTVGLTYLRGLQVPDSKRIIEIPTKFPGYYSGRVQNAHDMAHVNETVVPNHISVGEGSTVHTGQFFFRQSR